MPHTREGRVDDFSLVPPERLETKGLLQRLSPAEYNPMSTPDLRLLAKCSIQRIRTLLQEETELH
jgi:hypothetical protein